MSSTLKIQRESDAVLSFQLSGKLLTPTTVDSLTEGVKTKVDSGARAIIIDLSDLDHMDSSGLNGILRAFTTIRNKGGQLALLQPSASVRKLLTISKLNTVFPIYDMKDDAYNYLTSDLT
ncbi:MAG: STAS domain-containing protein [Bacteroidota bacterium]